MEIRRSPQLRCARIRSYLACLRRFLLNFPEPDKSSLMGEKLKFILQQREPNRVAARRRPALPATFRQTLITMITAAFPRRVFGKRDQRARDPSTDRALEELASGWSWCKTR